MSITFNCPHCQKAHKVKDNLAGKRAKCSGCQKVITIPAPVAQAADVEALAAAALAEQPAAPAPVQQPATIEFTCYYCDEKVSVSVELCGKQTPCPECRRIIKVPLLKKEEPKDWRKVETRLPAGARRDAGPAPEGTWDAGSVGVVSRQALLEAEAIPQVRKRLTWQQWVKRGSAAAAALGVLAFVSWLVIDFVSQNRQNRALAKALEYAETKGKLTPGAAAEVYRAAGEFSLRAGTAKDAENARNQFQKSRAALLQVPDANPGEREALLIALARSQVDLGGDRPDTDKGRRLQWDEAQKEFQRTLQHLSSPEGRSEGLREVTRRLIAKGQDKRAAPLATQLFPEDDAELLAVVGLEMLRAKHEQVAETLATQAQQRFLSQGRPASGPNPTRLSVPSLLALWIALGKQDKVQALLPAPAAAKEPEIGVLLGLAEGAARRGDWQTARAKAEEAGAPHDRLAVLITLASVAVENDAESARPDVEKALNLVEGPLKGKPVSPWLLWRLVRIGARAGLEERAQVLARQIQDPSFRGWAQLEMLRGHLAGTKERADEAWVQQVDKDSFAQGVAQEAVARHNTRYGGGSAVQKSIDSLEPEKLRPFGYVGLALGLQDREGDPSLTR
jgi:hypothetical protein